MSITITPAESPAVGAALDNLTTAIMELVNVSRDEALAEYALKAVAWVDVIREAITIGEEIDVLYRKVNESSPRWRRIRPTSVNEVKVVGYDLDKEDFRAFLMSGVHHVSLRAA